MKTARILLSSNPLTINDAARIILEITESLAPISEHLSRTDLLNLIRQVTAEGVRAIRQSKNTVTFKEAALYSISARQGRRPTTIRDLRHFIGRMLRVEGVAQRPLRAITCTECRHILQTAFGNSPSSYRKGRVILHSIFAYGYRREWCDANPVSRIEIPTVMEKEIVPLRPNEIDQLKRTAERPPFAALQFPLHLMLYCGLRPTEVERLDPQRDIDWKEKTVTIRPFVSKTGGGRVIPLRNITPAFVNTFKAVTTLKQAPSLWRQFRRQAGFRHWVPDILRHTFATYHAVHFRNILELQLEMGHRDTTLLRMRYINAAYINKKEAQTFWQR